jgi:OmpA-OmpF porin, OOP family
MNQFKCTRPMAALALAVAVGSGFAVMTQSAMAEPGIYIGAAYGMASVDGEEFDDDTQVLKAFVGGKFNDYIGVELAANDYGEAEGRGYKTELTGYTAALVGYLPMGDRFDLFAKIGNLWWKNDFTVLGYSDDITGDELFFGLGGQFNFSENFALRLEWERYEVDLTSDEIGFDLDTTYDVDVASLGVAFTF